MKLKTPKRIVLKMQQKMPRKSWNKKGEFQNKKKKPKLKIAIFKSWKKKTTKKRPFQENEIKKTQIEDVNFWKCLKKREIRHKIIKKKKQRIIKKKSAFENL